MIPDTRQPIPQACAVPFRAVGPTTEFCLITSMARKRWGFPKGIIEPGETMPEAAHKESWEEAGVRGEIIGQPLGSYEYAKWGTTLDVTVVLLQVTEAHDRRPEAHLRQRRWATADEVRKLVQQADQLRLFEVACRRISELRGG